MPGESKRTSDHEKIKNWVNERDGVPAVVADTAGQKKGGVLRISFPGFGGKRSLKPISWNRFFEIFDSNKLDFLYQEQLCSGEESRFFKFVARD